MKFKHSFRLTIFFTLTLALFLIGEIYYDTNSIEIRHYQIHHFLLGEALADLKVAHLSDLHIKRIGLREDKIIRILKEEKPDLILLTGDSIGFQNSYGSAISFFKQLSASYGVYSVLGNTEYSNENGSCILCHAKNSKSLKDNPSPVFLRNSFRLINYKGKVFNLIGLDDPVEKKGDLKQAVCGIDPKAPTILLAHSPQVIEEAAECGIDFLLCGHTHGGQIFPVKYLRRFIPLEQAFKFPEGFFQEGKTLMYVSQGVGTSFLPFRLGVKPEIAFFTFSNNIDQSVGSFTISNSSTNIAFAGLSFRSFLDIFDFFNIFSSPSSSILPQPSALSPESLALSPQCSNFAPNADVLFDFESDSDLLKLNWQCHKWFERSSKHATNGQYSLRVELPPGRYSGISFREIKTDWSKSKYFKMDVFNASKEGFVFHIRIDDEKSGWDYANRFDYNFSLKAGINHLSIPADSIKTNSNSRRLDLNRIKRFAVFAPQNDQKRELYIDYIRLE